MFDSSGDREKAVVEKLFMMKRGYIIPAALLSALFFMAASIPAQTPAVQERISVSATDCSTPRVTGNDRGDIFAVWSGKLGERSRIFFRERKGEMWGPEIVIDQSEWGNNTDPVMAVDGQGNPCVVWAFSDPELTAVYYTLRINGEWLPPLALRESREKNCEFPDIAVEMETNRVYISWQEGRGSSYAVFCATQNDEGGFVPEKLSSPDDTGYNLYPRVFLAPTPFVTWYGVGESDFILHASLWNIQSEKWMRYDPAGFERLPTNRFPSILSDPGGNLSAVWYDSDGSTDRIYFARQGEPGYGRGGIVDGNPERMNSLPTGAIGPDGEVFLCWRGESIFGGQIFLAEGAMMSNPGFEESRLVSDGQKLFYTQPDCALLPDGDLAMIWSSSAMDGGDGAVYFRICRP